MGRFSDEDKQRMAQAAGAAAMEMLDTLQCDDVLERLADAIVAIEALTRDLVLLGVKPREAFSWVTGALSLCVLDASGAESE